MFSHQQNAMNEVKSGIKAFRAASDVSLRIASIVVDASAVLAWVYAVSLNFRECKLK